MATRLDTPRESGRPWRRRRTEADAFGRFAEGIARFMGTPKFLLYMSLFCVLWIAWNTLMPNQWRFDSSALGFTALTLILSLQASYAAPLILLAQNRQDDRDRMTAESDRVTAARNLSDTEYLAREVASLRLALADVATRDFVRSELHDMLEELAAEREAQIAGPAPLAEAAGPDDGAAGPAPAERD
jgi:uncharacterized membrane protein